MRWSTLFTKIGKLPLKITQNHNIHAVLDNPAIGEWESIPLCLKYDAKGRPYLIKDPKVPLTIRKRKRG